MAHFHKLIPAQPTLVNVAVPFFSKIGDAPNKELDINPCEISTFNDLGLYGANLNFINRPLFIGPKVQTDLLDVVLGIDQVNFVATNNQFDFPDIEKLNNIRSFDPVERYVSEKIYNQGFYDYDVAVQNGTDLISGMGLRTGNYDFFGKCDYYIVDKEKYFVVAVPNNRELNPTVCMVVDYENIPIMTANLDLIKKDYYNFYLSKKKITTGKYIYGFINLSSVAVVYFADTGVYIDGMRDHQ